MNIPKLNMTKSEFIRLATNVIIIIAGLLVSFEVIQPDPEPVVPVVNVEAPAAGDVATARGTTNFEDLVVDSLTYGDDSLSPLGFSTAGSQLVYGTTTITGTAALAHGLTTVTFCQATLGEDPTAGAGDAAHVSVAVAANVCTAKVWQDDFVTAATETDVDVHWLVVGLP